MAKIIETLQTAPSSCPPARRPDSPRQLFVLAFAGLIWTAGERRSMSEADYASLVTAAHNQLHAPVILVWEGVWAHMKNGLGSLAAADVGQLTAIIKNRLKSIQYRPALIDAFLAQTRPTLEPQPP